jgi:hypothetical protein
MMARIPVDALLETIERRLDEISERQHALAVEKAYLLEQRTPLRLGVASPDAALVQLRSRGIILRGWTSALPRNRRARPMVLRAVAPRRLREALPAPRSETA